MYVLFNTARHWLLDKGLRRQLWSDSFAMRFVIAKGRRKRGRYFVLCTFLHTICFPKDVRIMFVFSNSMLRLLPGNLWVRRSGQQSERLSFERYGSFCICLLSSFGSLFFQSTQTGMQTSVNSQGFCWRLEDSFNRMRCSLDFLYPPGVSLLKGLNCSRFLKGSA